MRNDMHQFVNNAIRLSLEMEDVRVINIFAGDMYDYRRGFDLLLGLYKDRENDNDIYCVVFEDLRDLILQNLLEEITMFCGDKESGFAIEVADRMKLLEEA